MVGQLVAELAGRSAVKMFSKTVVQLAVEMVEQLVLS
jgi:hypothetical protein